MNILALEIVGRATESAEDLRRSLAILRELATSMPAYEEGTTTVQERPGKLYVSFPSELDRPVRLALELADLLQELPSLTIRMAIHSDPDPLASSEISSLLEGAASGDIVLSESYAKALEDANQWPEQVEAEVEAGRQVIRRQRLVLVGDTQKLGSALEQALGRDGHDVGNDRPPAEILAWARSLEERIRSADTVVAFVSPDSADDEVLRYQLEVAADERRKRGFPQIVPVWMTDGAAPDGPLSILQQNLHQTSWSGPPDEGRLIEEVRSVIAKGQEELDPELLETLGGAVPTDSRFYVRRTADLALEKALGRHESIVLLKGPRQIGKTSLIGHGLGIAEGRTAITDFQKLSSRQLQSEESFCRVLATTLAHQLGVPFDFEKEWFEPLGGNLNLDRFIRDFLEAVPGHIVWFIDEADRLFTSPFASDFYGLVRSWHNSRATERNGPWRRLTIVIAYATEAHLFISDLNQSPFNVGHPIDIPMFTVEDTIDLNSRYGLPIRSDADVSKLHELIGGHPFLTRRAFDALVLRQLSFDELMKNADSDDGPFGDHLKRMLISVTQLSGVREALLHSLSSPTVSDSDDIYRLIAAGILVRRAGKGLELSCELYRRYLLRHLP